MRFDGREEQLETLREVADNIFDPVFLVDRSFNVWYYNRAFESAVGVRLSSKRFQHKQCHELLGLRTCANNCVMKHVVDSNQRLALAEIPGMVASGEHRNFHINAIPVTNSQGNPFGALIFLKDVTVETQVQEKYKHLVARNTSIALSGKIEGGNLVDILQLFIFLQKSGVLNLNFGDVRGDLFFKAGKVIAINGSGCQDAKALDRFLRMEQGLFSFNPQLPLDTEIRLELSTDFLLMDALREKDELLARHVELPTFETAIVAQPLQEAVDMKEAETLIHQWFVSGHDFYTLLQNSPMPDSRICLTMLSLRARGLLAWS